MKGPISRFSVRRAGLAAAVIVLCSGTAPEARAAIVASGEIAGEAAGKGFYDYTVRLNNSASSTSPLQTFWYAWLAGGGNYLPSAPTGVDAPPGWTFVITHDGPTDGYSIQFETSTAALQPGSSLDFSFTTQDSPSSLKSSSPFYPGIPVGSSAVYSGHSTGLHYEFAVKSVTSLPATVPEPSMLPLLGVGLVALGGAAFFRRRNPRSSAS